MPSLIDTFITDAEFKQISELVHRHCGICLHAGKRELVQARVSKELRQRGLSNFGQYKRMIEADASGVEFSRLIDAISTNHTSFFREHRHFDFLRDQWLPKFVGHKHKHRSLKAWSAACSSGEEAYSLAITLNEGLAKPSGWDLKLLATDISRRMLAVAEAGVYDAAKLQPVPPVYRAKYFKPFGGGGDAFIAGENLKNLIRYRYLNLIEPWPFSGRFEVIFCRNVMIYFDKPTQQKTVAALYDRLTPGGVLFTGHSESLSGLKHEFEYVQPTIYRRPGGWK